MSNYGKGSGVRGNPLAQQLKFISNLFANSLLRMEYLSLVVDHLKIWTGCECVGIRVVNDGGTMPYEAFVGFSHDFWEQENWLSIREHQCACIRVVLGRPDPLDRQILTPGGSLWSNNLQAFGNAITEENRSRYRGKCIECGFDSLAVIPIRQEGAIIGVVHIADVRGNMLSLEKVLLLESASEAIGRSLVRYSAEDRLNAWEEALRRQLSDLRGEVGKVRTVCNSAELLELLDLLEEKIAAV